MKKHSITFLSFCFAFANVFAQELPKPSLPSPEDTFYSYLDNENISDVSNYQGNVKKVVRTQNEYIEGVTATTLEKTTYYVNAEGNLEKTEVRTYAYGVEDSKTVTNHLTSPKVTVETNGNRTIKTVKLEIPEDEFEYVDEFVGDDRYVYEKDRLIAFYNNNDSISYLYNSDNQLVEIKKFESIVMQEYNDEDESITYLRTEFEDKALFRVTYKNGLLVHKEVYDKFGEVIDIYKTSYSYSDAKLLEKFQTIYKRYLFDYYDNSIVIDKQRYEEFPLVTTEDSIQSASFTYSPKNNISSYQREVGKEKETYDITFDANDRLYLVKGNLEFYKDGRLRSLQVEYEYLYDEKGNPSTIKSFYYVGTKKMLHKETIFEIEYYTK